MSPTKQWLRPDLVLFFCFMFLEGCGGGPRVVPVQGTVQFEGKPLRYGSVMFQPESGQPARGTIQPDGSFVLTTYNKGDGAVVGTHRVRITAYESQNPRASQVAQTELALGRSLIPKRYTDYDTSGIVVEVGADRNEPFLLELTE